MMKTIFKLLTRKRKSYFSCSLFVWMLFLSVNSIQAQSKTITGSVKDAEGYGLPEASVNIKGTNTGTVSDFDGNYSITAKEGDVLVYNFIGFTSKEIVVGSQSTINVTLESSNVLDEVVVVGYGTQRKSDLTGAVSSVKAEELTKAPMARTDQLLQGKAAGVAISSTDGAPGGNVKIRIRGANSINGDNSPLVVIDGFLGGSLSTLNPLDIKSIEVLKDASATAVYGSRGANGVILVTTKTGKKGKVTVDYSTYVSVSSLRKKLDVLDALGYATIENERLVSGGASAIHTQADLDKYTTATGIDWQDEIFRTAIQKNNNLSVSGGNDKSTYLFSLNHVDEEGILINSSYKRYQFRSNLNANLTDKIKIGVRAYGVREESNPQRYNSTGSPVSHALTFPSTVQTVYNTDGSFTQVTEPSLWNPVATAKSYTADNFVNTFNINGFVDFELTENLTLNLAAGASYLSNNFYTFISTDDRSGVVSNGEASVVNKESTGWINTNNLTYSKDIGEEDRLTATLVYEQQQIGADRQNGFGVQDFVSQSLGYYGADAANTISNAYVSPLTKKTIQSFLGRVNYSLKDQWLFTVSGRYDGSSVLGDGNKWSFFPSAAVAYKVNSDIKLRASYGQVGSQAVEANSTQSTLSSGNNYSLDGTSATVGVSPQTVGNSNLGWEKTTQYDFGADFKVLESRLGIGIDVYYKRTSDMLLRTTLPAVAGIANSSVLRNIGELENRGAELTLDVQAIKNESLTWDLNANIAINRNKVLDLGGVDQIEAGKYGGSSAPALFIIEEGAPLGNIHGLKYLGTWKTEEAAAAAAYGKVPGDSKYSDVNGDGIISNDDRIVIGNGTPDFTWALNSNLAYKQFDLNLSVNAAHGFDVYNATRNSMVDNLTAGELANRWSPSNNSSNIAAPSATDTQVFNSSRYVEDASFVRLRNVTLGYNFDQKLLERINISNLRLYVSGQNLITITDYTGFDPEVNSAGSSDTDSGLDLGGYPPSKIFTVGLNVTF